MFLIKKLNPFRKAVAPAPEPLRLNNIVSAFTKVKSELEALVNQNKGVIANNDNVIAKLQAANAAHTEEMEDALRIRENIIGLTLAK